jgi:hypothetical protein
MHKDTIMQQPDVVRERIALFNEPGVGWLYE